MTHPYGLSISIIDGGQTEADLLTIGNENVFFDVKMGTSNGNWKLKQITQLKSAIEDTITGARVGASAIHRAIFPIGKSSGGSLGNFNNEKAKGYIRNEVEVINTYFRNTYQLTYDVIIKVDAGPIP